jgi:ribosomal protein S8
MTRGNGSGDVGNTKAGRNRNRNYSELEDLLITKAYVSVSTDPIHGSQQKGTIFWSKVHQKFKLFATKEPGGNELRGRPVDSLKQRYTKVISKAVAKYNKFYKTLKNDNKSGWNEEMYMDEASKLYEEEEGRPFRFLSCVEALHKVPKFDPMVSDVVEQQSKRINNSHRPQGASIERPIGSKKAKIVKYLQESGVVVGGEAIDESNSVSVNTNTASSIEQLLQNNYQQRERVMKLKRVKIYIELGEKDKARVLMREIEEEEEKNRTTVSNIPNAGAGGDNNVPFEIDAIEQPVASMPQLPSRIPMPPGIGAPIHEIDIEQGKTFPESQLTEM